MLLISHNVFFLKETNEFYKQPMFYTMGHFSKFIRADSKRLYSQIDDTSKEIQAAAFSDVKKNLIIVVVLNK